MSSYLEHPGRRACRQASVAAATYIIILAAAVPVNADPKQAEVETSASIEKLRSEDPPTRDKAVDAIREERLSTVKKLISLIDPANAADNSDQTRCAAAFLLGEFRAVEAVPVLSQALADEPGRKMRSRISRYDAPVFNALVKIGRPVVPAMIENIKNSDNLVLRRRSLSVLYRVVGGRRRLLELLEKVEAVATDERSRQRVHECVTLTREQYSETTEPLY